MKGKARTGKLHDATTKDLLKKLTRLTRQVSLGHYDNARAVFELTKTGDYPRVITTLAEAFGMMIVKVETREFRLEQLVEDLEATCRDLTAAKRDLEQLNRTLEQRVESRTAQLHKKNEDLRQTLEQLRKEIRERKRLNGQLEEANRKLLDAYLFMKQSKDRLASRQYAESVVFLIDPEGRICGVTEKALELTGKNRSQLNASQIDDLFTPLEGRSVKDLLRQVQPRLPLRTSLRMKSSKEDGRHFNAKLTRVAFEGKRFIYAVLYEAGED